MSVAMGVAFCKIMEKIMVLLVGGFKFGIYGRKSTQQKKRREKGSQKLK